MPVIHSRSAGAPACELVQELVSELKEPHESGQPIILRNAIGESDAFNVYVIWDRWEGLSAPDRSATIREAFNNYDPSITSKIPIAEGRTPAEAISEGLLPVSIKPLLRRDDPYSTDEIREAMKAAGAFETPNGPQLRFARIEDAEEIYRRLNKSFPAIFALVVEEPRWE